MEQRCEYLIVGSGIAGLFFAIKVAEQDPEARVIIVTKKRATDTSTNRAQGGIAAVLSGSDSFEKHIKDTLTAGAGLCHEDVVARVVESGPAVIAELVQYGVAFTGRKGHLDLGREGGHSANRVVHAADLTGREIERALLDVCESRDNVTLLKNHMVVDLITHQHGNVRHCAGARVLKENGETISSIIAPVTMLATGGMGQIYYHTSNPKIATGDGVAIAHRAGVSVANLEFMQFHPTTLYSPGRRPFLISEAVRGEGGRLKSVDGRFFMEDAHELKELAPRDIVARAIDKELKASGEEYVLLDISHRDSAFIRKRFPNIFRECLRYGFDITQRSVPVVPAAHYACGGVLADIEGVTELPGLFVAGEVAMTGMHGANRLASNSLLEAVVMAEFAARQALQFRRDIDFPQHVEADYPAEAPPDPDQEKILFSHHKRDLQRVMSDFVGIVRTEERLKIALGKARRIKYTVDEEYAVRPATYNLAELRNMVMLAELVIESAILRPESRGLHYLEGIPKSYDEFKRDTIIPGHTDTETDDADYARYDSHT